MWDVQNMLFLLACLLFAALGVRKDRKSWAMLGGMAAFNVALNKLLLDAVDHPYELVLHGLCEMATAALLLSFARGRLIERMLWPLAVAFCVHMVTYVDLQLGTNAAYDNYHLYLLLIAIWQIMLGYESAVRIFQRVRIRNKRGSVLGVGSYSVRVVDSPDSQKEEGDGKGRKW